ncbi:MAG: SDR family oxidoreductase [Balneolaceae bacterium]|nr:SDR family oxidoreductase [Balneolaceae bacterium]
MSSFKNKNVLITGGASGIGYIMGRLALERGARHLVIWDINEDALDKAAEQLRTGDASVSSNVVDVREPDAVTQAAEHLLEDLPAIDILINNAGIVVGKSFSEQSMDDIRNTMEVNSLGLMYVARAFLPTMLKKRSGHIVNITSAVGLTPNPGMTIYAASKWAAVGWSESLKLELQQNSESVRVLTVMPSYIDTGMFEGVSPPLWMPVLDPQVISEKILDAVEQNKSRLREPFMVKITPFLKGILPAPIFDFIAGKIFNVYSSMSTFKGRN